MLRPRSYDADAEVIECEAPLLDPDFLSQTTQARQARQASPNQVSQVTNRQWLFYVLHREWCDHIILYEDGTFQQGNLGGMGSWQLQQPQGGALLLEMQWAVEGGGPREFYVSPDGSTSRFIAGPWEMRRIGDDVLPWKCLGTPRPRRALLFSSVGRQCLAVVRDHWLCSPSEVDFDVVLVYYKEEDSDAYQELLKFSKLHSFVKVIPNEGLKWPNLCRWVEMQGGPEAVVARYDYIWVVDDDVRLCTEGINMLFSVLRSNDHIQFASPSFDAASVGVWRYFDKHDPKYHLRYTDFVECAATVMNSSMLLDAKFTELLAAARSGCFLDFCFHPVSGARNNAVAIIDAVQANHPARDKASSSEMEDVFPWKDHKGDMVFFERIKVPTDWWWYRKPRLISGLLVGDELPGAKKDEEWEIVEP